MNEIDIMQHNLSKLLSQHQSTPNLIENQPSDPFQKRLFGKKTRRSHISATDENLKSNSLSKIEETLDEEHQQSTSLLNKRKTHDNKVIILRQQDNEQSQVYERQIQKLINKLKRSLITIEDNYKNKVKQVCHLQKGQTRQKMVQQLIGNLEGSVQFIIKDCFQIPEAKSQIKLRNIVYHTKSQRCRQNQKQNCKISHNVNNYDSNKDSNKSYRNEKPSSKQSKSIYESILQQRKMRLSKKRMI